MVNTAKQIQSIFMGYMAFSYYTELGLFILLETLVDLSVHLHLMLINVAQSAVNNKIYEALMPIT
jgi:hypothetical protein